MDQPKMFRQGDVLLIQRTTSLPKGKKRVVKSGILAEGEVTGHMHQVRPEDMALIPVLMGKQKVKKPGAEVFKIGSSMFMDVNKDSVVLQHPEHGTNVIPQGEYEVKIQQEYSPARSHNVYD